MQRKESKYENGVIYWQCTTCKEWKPEDEYYHDTRTANGLKSQCRKCHTQTGIKTRNPENAKRLNREYMRRARQSNPAKYRDRERDASRERPKNEKTKTREILNNAVATGRIIRPTNCSQCGRLRRITAHHDDYSKPLQVRWLCYECHSNN